MTEPLVKVPPTSDIIKHWESFGKIYAERFEYNTQPMLYSLVVNLKITEANQILELSVGGGKSLPIILSLKKPECKYFATEISEKMLNLSSARMEFIEEDFKGSLQFFDERAFQELNSKEYRREFPKSNASFALMNNEALGFSDESFDICFSNLSLMIVENPEKQLNESFRVLKKGGRVGFTVWASEDNSIFFSLPRKVVAEHGYGLPPDRSCFHLNDRKMLISMLEQAGFKKVLCWSQFFAYNFHTKKDFEYHLDTKGITKIFEEVPDLEERKNIRQEVLDKFMEFIEMGQPVGLDILFVIGEKP